MALQKVWVFLFLTLFSAYSFGTMQIELLVHSHDNYFQVVGSGLVHFTENGTNTFISPVRNGSFSTPPECEEGQTYSWNVENIAPIPEESEENDEDGAAAHPPLPNLRLQRHGQPVSELFTLPAGISDGKLARYVRRTQGEQGTQFTLTDGHWYEGQWVAAVAPDNYQLNGDNHLPLSRLIYSFLVNHSITNLQSQDVFDDLFYTPHNASIWICIVAGLGKTRVKIQIRTENNEYIAILELEDPESSSSSSSSPQFSDSSSPSPKRRRSTGGTGGTGGARKHPLTRSQRSASSLWRSAFSSGKSTTSMESEELYRSNHTVDFTGHMAFLIISLFQPHKYTL